MAEATDQIPVRLISCEVPASRLEQLRMLVAWCETRTHIQDLCVLSEIIVTPRENIADAANEFMARVGERPSVRTSASAVAVPAVSEGRLTAAIVLDVAHLNAFDQTHTELDYFALTLLEEMLHIRHYSITFQRRGFIHYNLPPQCQSLLHELAYHLLDEYLVGRWKADLVSAEIFYGGNLPRDIEDGLFRLARIVVEAASARVAISDSWSRTADIITGPTFGALVREAGRTATRNTPSPAGDPTSSIMFLDHVALYWNSTLEDLVHAFDDLRTEDEAVAQVASQLANFLEHCGVTLIPMPDGGCWVNFASQWAEGILSSRVA
jgi:hypothetical protein